MGVGVSYAAMEMSETSTACIKTYLSKDHCWRRDGCRFETTPTALEVDVIFSIVKRAYSIKGMYEYLHVSNYMVRVQ